MGEKRRGGDEGCRERTDLIGNILSVNAERTHVKQVSGVYGKVFDLLRMVMY